MVYKVVSHNNEEEEEELSLITYESIKSYDVLIFANPQIDFQPSEIDAISIFLEEGKSVAFFGNGSDHSNTRTIHLPNLETFLLEQGIKLENDTVVRTSFHKYLHPKHVYIDDGALHPALLDNNDSDSELGWKKNHGDKSLFDGAGGDDDGSMLQLLEEEKNALKIVYVKGSTLDVTAPSLPILSSGAISFPSNRPIAAISGQRQNGKLFVIGSSDMFANEWIEKEANKSFLEQMIQFLLHDDKVTFERSQSRKDNRIDDPKVVPDIEALSERLRSCLEENRPLPQDLNSLLIHDLLTYDTNMIPEVVELFHRLNVKKEALTLIPPEFERPIPPLKPAVFHPKMKELPLPALEKFDLDEEFAESTVRLARLTNACTDEDMDYYIQEAGSIAGLVDEQDENVDAKAVLHTLFAKVSRYFYSCELGNSFFLSLEV